MSSPAGQPPKQTTDSSVFALISAFISGQDIFKKLKEQRQRRKTRKEEKETAAQQAERLGSSLHRGPQEIQTAYEQNFALHGQQFRDGDAHAHASLATTLLKLNNGLVSIISQFLGNGKKTKSLDYDALTILSETSRLETVDALNSLAYRLSQSRLLNFMRPSKKRAEHAKAPKRRTSGKNSSPVRAGSKTLPLRQVSSSNVSSTQLALVRPRPKPKRTASAGSNRHASTTKLRSQSTAALGSFPPPSFASPTKKPAQPVPTPPMTPRTSLQHSRDPRQQSSMKSRLARSTPNLLSMPFRRPNGTATTSTALAPPTPPDSPTAATITTPANFATHLLPPQVPPVPQPTPTTTAPALPHHHQSFSSTTTAPRHPRRHATQKSTTSSLRTFRTFASDSTKLGEIPQHRLAQPFDYAEMARLNAAAALAASLGGAVPARGGEAGGQRAHAVALAGGGGAGGVAKGGFWGGLFGRRKGGRGAVVVG